jgi:hypothetical protein
MMGILQTVAQASPAVFSVIPEKFALTLLFAPIFQKEIVV